MMTPAKVFQGKWEAEMVYHCLPPQSLPRLLPIEVPTRLPGWHQTIPCCLPLPITTLVQYFSKERCSPSCFSDSFNEKKPLQPPPPGQITLEISVSVCCNDVTHNLFHYYEWSVQQKWNVLLRASERMDQWCHLTLSHRVSVGWNLVFLGAHEADQVMLFVLWCWAISGWCGGCERGARRNSCLVGCGGSHQKSSKHFCRLVKTMTASSHESTPWHFQA